MEEAAVAVEIVETAVETEATVQTVEIVPNAATVVTAATLVAEGVAIVDVDVLTSEAATVVVAVEDEAAMLLMSPIRALSRVSAHDALQSHLKHLMLALLLRRRKVCNSETTLKTQPSIAPPTGGLE